MQTVKLAAILLDMKRLFGIILALLIPCSCLALGPHEILLLVNRSSTRSILIAGEFARLRDIPDVNIVYLSIPDSALTPAPEITKQEFADLIWKPAVKEIKERGIGDHILAWVYSTDFPVRINTKPAVSIQGITFVRNRLPAPDRIVNGLYSSPLFAGPESAGGKIFPSQTLDVHSIWLRGEMPLPSMMLGYAGKLGNDVDTITRCLTDGAKSDGSKPKAPVFFVTNDKVWPLKKEKLLPVPELKKHVRIIARQWQFAAAIKEAAEIGVSAKVVIAPPTKHAGMLGILMGTANVSPAAYGKFLPGSFADHLTSSAGVFDSASQTKLTEWIKAGATASAGTVTEPMAIWSKFPAARMFVHYGKGCTMIESLYQSIRCPMQILLVGEPLASPWKPKAKLIIEGADGNKSGKVIVTAEVKAGSETSFSRFVFLLNGKTVSNAAAAPANTGKLELDTTKLQDGFHRLRVIGYSTGSVRHQVFSETSLAVRNQFR